MNKAHLLVFRDYKNTVTEHLTDMETELAESNNEDPNEMDTDITVNDNVGENPLKETTTILVTHNIETEDNISRQEECTVSQTTLHSERANAIDKVLTVKALVQKLDTLRTQVKVNKKSEDVQQYQTTICIVKLELEKAVNSYKVQSGSTNTAITSNTAVYHRVLIKNIPSYRKRGITSKNY